ncbi:membrane protein [Methylophilus rhizosphaerae]|uniref:Membrane protein n=1 Tax=Methylophilus rhizosphaerae TaxID=492660 RepID=A0A1G8ZDG6_9PROT|nr:YihY/virulence factor BrkB family protein [Methylophilus rhizosphaerae]SDK13067.1 membrane protein [Methylophilus rhizosphaerae]
MPVKQAWIFIKSVFRSWNDDHAQSMGAALAYYTLFSIAPLLLIVIAISGIVFGPQAARGEILGQLNSLMGEQGARAVQALLESTNQPTEGVAATAIGMVLLLVGATTVFGELQDSLDRIWRAPVRDNSGLWSLVRARLLSFGMIMGIGFLLMVSLIFSAGLSAMNKWWSPVFADWMLIASIVNVVFSFLLTTGMFAMIYKVMPRASIRWSEVWTGAAITAALFTVGKWLIGIYIGRSAISSSYGAAGSLLALLVWIYYSAQIFLLGAEFTWAYSHFFGSRKGKHMLPSLAKRAPENERSTPVPDSPPAKVTRARK